jgi:KDO2-lipid IV(A) lauroyltransferase
MPITVMYRPPKIRALDAVMRVGRSRGNAMTSVPADMGGVRAMLKALRRGEAIGVLPDQVPGVGEGEWVPFFGRPAYTMTLLARMSEKTGAPVFLCFAERLPGGRGYRFSAEPLPAAQASESPLRALNRAIEQMVRRRPEQYLWGYNRYKVPAGVQPPAAG